MQNPPYKACADFYMVYYSPADHSELKRTLYTANFVFLFKTNVPMRSFSCASPSAAACLNELASSLCRTSIAEK
jgi:hypothetical protein